MLDPQQYTELRCSLACEHIAASGATTKRTTHSAAALVLGRTEHGEVTMRANLALSGPSLALSLRDLVVHRKFVAEGKATFVIAHPNRVNLMVSNCPPDHLMMFLR